GYAPAGPLAEADLVVVLDSGVPWIEAAGRPAPGTRVVHVGPDPLFARMPVRGFRCDLAITADPAAVLDALAAELPAPTPAVAARRDRIAARAAARREAAATLAAAGAAGPMSAEWMSACLAEAIGPEAR